MNTPAHLIFGAAAFARPDRRDVTLAAICGALLPDMSLYLMVGWSLFVREVPPETVFGTYYFSDEWQAVFAVDNSFVIWGAGLLLGLNLRNPVITAFAGAGLLHLGCDFVLHNEDARMQLWPVSTWVFRSPFSYWDRNHHGGIIGPVEIVVSLALCVLLWRRFKSWTARGLILLAAALEAAPGIMFALMFRGAGP